MAPPDGIETFSESNWDGEALASRVPVVVGFWAEWCVPCRMAAPALVEAAGAFRGRMRFGLVNVDENPALAARYRIQGLPTVIVLKDGRICEKRVGLMGRAGRRRLVERCLG